MRRLARAGVAMAGAVAFAACADGSKRAPDSVAPSADSARAAVTAADSAAVPAIPAAPAAPASAANPASGAAAAPAAAKPATKGATPPRSPAVPAPSNASDTLRGVPAVVGSSPFLQVVLRPTAGGSVRLSGPLAQEVGRASGADVWVRGSLKDRAFEVTSYHVRAVDGVPAVDGVLVAEGDRLYLRLADGSRRAIVSPSAALRAEAGARVWITGGLDGPVAAFGVLRPRS